MKKKTIKCPKCGNEVEVEPDETYHECPECGKEFMTAYFGKIGEEWY